MTKKIKSIASVTAMAVIGGLLAINCEAESDRLGEQFFQDTGAVGTEISYDVVAYNIFNNDTIRTDKAFISNAVLGAFDEGVFGKQKAAYVAQARLNNYNPTFGTNAKVDSVVLSIQPNYVADSLTTSEDTNFNYNGTITKKVVKTYPVSKYGNITTNGGATFSPITIQVHEVTDFLGGPNQKRFSNESVSYNATLLGEKTLTTNVSSVQITNKETNQELLNLNAAFRIKLDNTFFQNKILNKQGSVELKDAANFVRWFKGVRLSVVEDDGYLFTFVPSNVNIKIYYNYESTSNGVTDIKNGVVTMPLGYTEASRFSQFYYDRAGTIMQAAMAASNPTTGDPKLYLQGMGGPSIGIKIPQTTITELKNLYATDHAAIVSAKIRLYTDIDQWNNGYTKPTALTILQKGSQTVPTDLTAFSGVSNFALVRAYDVNLNPAYYDFTITQTVKEIIEANKENKDFVINLGSFLQNSTNGAFLAAHYTTRASSPYRLVMVGTDASNPHRAQMKLIYGKKMQ